MKKILQLTGTVFLFYILYAFVISTLPFMRRVRVSRNNKKRLSNMDFYGNEGGSSDRVRLIEQPHDALNLRVEMIRSATSSIDVVYHTIHFGGSSDAFLAELLRAADRGVRVRLLLDGKVGAADKRLLRKIQALGEHPNIQCRFYNRARLLAPWNWHALLHDKFLMIDGRLLLTGGRNIGDKYFAPEGYDGKITQDRDVFVENTEQHGAKSVLPQVRKYIQSLWTSKYVSSPPRAKRSLDLCHERTMLEESALAFEQANPTLYAYTLDWYRAEMLPCNKISLIYNPIHRSKKEPWVGYNLCTLMESAHSNVVMQTPYATKNSTLLSSMKRCKDRIHFTMVTNSLASSPNYPAFSNYYTNRRHFIKTGADIFEYQSDDSIHGKSLVIDDHLGVVGSFNMDERSFYIDTETMLVIDSPDFAQQLRDAIDFYRAQSLCVCDGGCDHDQKISAHPVPWGKNVLMRFVSVFSRVFQFLI